MESMILTLIRAALRSGHGYTNQMELKIPISSVSIAISIKLHQVSSFPGICVRLRHVQYLVNEDSTCTVVHDGFIRELPT